MTTATTPFQVYLTLKDSKAAIDFYGRAFGATVELEQMADDGARVLHATLAMLGHHIMLSDEFPEHETRVAAPAGATTVTVHVNLGSEADVDAVMAQAVAAGAETTMPAQKMFWGAYYGRLIDPFGHSWSFASGH